MPLEESRLELPYRLILDKDGQIPAESDGLQFWDIEWTNNFPIDRLDYEAGEVQYIYELSLSCSGTDQTYIGVVVENEPRKLFGSYSFEREGFAEAGSRQPLQFEKTRILWRSEIYRLSRNQAARAKSIQLGVKPILELEPPGAIPLNISQSQDTLAGTLRLMSGYGSRIGGKIYEGSSEISRWELTTPDSLTIAGGAGGGSTPNEGVIEAAQLTYSVKYADIVFGERLSLYKDLVDVGILEAYRERSKINISLYQGVSADYTLKIYQAGLYRQSDQLPNYPTGPPPPPPPPSGGDQ